MKIATQLKDRGTEGLVLEDGRQKSHNGENIVQGMLVAIAPQVENYQLLLASLRPGTRAMVLDPDRDALEQITRALSDDPARSLHLVCHGGPGALHLGNTPVTSEKLHLYSGLLQEWAVEDILLYACNVAADNSRLLADLHQLTGANIAASRYRVGNEAKGGSWRLETHIGSVASESAFLPVVKNYPGVLVSFTTEKVDVEARPEVVAVGEFNGDGFPDVAVAEGGTRIESDYEYHYSFYFGEEIYKVESYSHNIELSVILGQEDGTFASGSTSNSSEIQGSTDSFLWAEEIAVADFDGDGLQDVAVIADYEGYSRYYDVFSMMEYTTYASNSVLSVMLNDGKGEFVESAFEQSYDDRFRAIAVGDLNGDGLPDLAIAGGNGIYDYDGKYTKDVAVRLNKGDGTFEDAKTIKEDGDPNSISIADINGDSRLDLIVTQADTDQLSVLRGKGNGEFKKATLYDVGDRPVDNTVADFNGDGFPDVAVANSSSNDISMLLNDGDGKLQAQTNYKVGTAPDNMVVADFNGDAILDLAVSVNEEGDTSKQNIVILQGNGDGTFEKDSTIDEVDADSLAVEDLNQDGSPDLVVGSGSEIALLFNNSATETAKISGTGKKDKLIGTNDGETIEGLGGNDTLNGKNGDDILDGGKGKDTMNGGKGDDTYLVDNPKDVIKESRNRGIDTVNASINYTLKNNVENLVLTGKKSLNGTGNNGKNEITGNDAKNVIKGKGGNDLLNGEGGSDRLFGDNGKDTLTGGGGNDILDGGKGNDTLTGGGGKDKFVFNTKRPFRSSDVGVDAIEDFILGDDKIVLDRTTFNSLKNNQFRDGREFEIVDTNAAAKNSNAFIVYNEASGDLFYNANGSKGGFGGGGLFAALDSGLDLSADDFTIKK